MHVYLTAGESRIPQTLEGVESCSTKQTVVDVPVKRNCTSQTFLSRSPVIKHLVASYTLCSHHQ